MTDEQRAAQLLAGWPMNDRGDLVIRRESALRDIAMLLTAVRERCAGVVEDYAVVLAAPPAAVCAGVRRRSRLRPRADRLYRGDPRDGG